MRLFFSLFFVLFLFSPVYSSTCVRYLADGTRVYYRCPEPERIADITYSVSTTRKNNKIVKKQIVKKSVCVEYDKGSLYRRECLKKARKSFKNKCYNLNSRMNKAPNTVQKYKLKLDRDMYCHAERFLKFAQ